MRLIDADELYEKEEERYKSSPTPYRLIYRGFVDDIADAPTVDAQPVVHAKWTDTYKNGYKPCNCVICNNCDKVSLGGKTEYCPHCGAKMDL